MQAPAIAQHRCYQPAVSFISLKTGCLSQGKATPQGDTASFSQHLYTRLSSRVMCDQAWKTEIIRFKLQGLMTATRQGWVLED